jgi:diketogulonate reductase-like aldo/keto reductase
MLTREFDRTGIQVPIIGQGTWRMGERPSRERQEIEALRLGVDLGLTHIDTAEIYGNGRTEELVGKAIAGRRHEVFLVSKVSPEHASYAGTIRACEQSLRRLRTDYLDLYLIHWWSDRYPIEETLRAMEDLVAAGKIRFIGVSNFTVEQMERAARALTRERIVCNQVCYHLKARQIEYRILPYCEERGIAVVGYSPFGSGDFPSPRSRGGRALAEIGAKYGKTPHQVALNFLTRRPGVFTIPKASRPEHVRENAEAVGWTLAPEDLAVLDAVFPPPTRERPLPII